jgi:Secretion system C-terminal sorting domain
MKKIYFSFLLLLISSTILIAQKQDNVWLGGLNEYPGALQNGNYMIRFDDSMPMVTPTNLNANFESTVTALSDSSGQLLYYTNGCSIYFAQGDTMKNGNWLNPGFIFDRTCPNTGYISPNGALFITKPGNDNFIYLFHMGVDYSADRRLTYGPFYVTIISKYGGTPKVIYKNEILLNVNYAGISNSVTYEPFTVVRHGNGRDWWLVIPEYNWNRYRIFLISSTGFFQQPYQDIGKKMRCKRIGSSIFSPDGSKYARQQNCGVTVMDFNRCTGKFSNPIWLPRPNETFGGGSVAFSDDGTQILTDGQLCILKADLTQTAPVFDTLIATEDIARTSLHHFQRGPDGKLYFSSLQTVNYMPTLEDGFGTTPIFKREGLALPVNSVRSLPHYPNYRLYDFPNSPCDTLGIDAPVATHELNLHDIEVSVSPNPFGEQINIHLREMQFKSPLFRLHDQLGRLVMEQNLVMGQNTITSSMLPNGIYFWQVRTENGRYKSGKLIKTGE